MARLPSVDTLKRKGDGRHSVGESLYLAIKGGSLLWEVRVKQKGTNISKSHIIGNAAEMSTEDAMALRRMPDRWLNSTAVPVMLTSGTMPTWAAAVADFIARKKPNADCVARLQRHTAVFNHRKLDAITSRMIADHMHDKLGWNGNRGQTASRVRADMEDVYNFHHAICPVNPATSDLVKAQLPNIKAEKTVHHASMPWQKVPEWMAWLKKPENNHSDKARALRLVTLTAVRINEALGARWCEIDLANRVWTIPAERMRKTGKAHMVPLTDAAVAVLGKPGKPDALIFDVSERTTLRHLQSFYKEATQHGLRSTFGTWGEETELGVENKQGVLDACLAHATKKGDNGDLENTAVRGAYFRSDFFAGRRIVMEKWAGFATGKAVQ